MWYYFLNVDELSFLIDLNYWSVIFFLCLYDTFDGFLVSNYRNYKEEHMKFDSSLLIYDKNLKE